MEMRRLQLQMNAKNSTDLVVFLFHNGRNSNLNDVLYIPDLYPI
jgi:hypothetical protein